MKQNTITLETAQRWAENWNTAEDPIGNVKAFNIPGYNAKEIVKEPNVVNIRAYMGINDDGVPTLIMVGVDVNGDDLIGVNNLIYDFTTPCPTMCNKKAPFINL